MEGRAPTTSGPARSLTGDVISEHTRLQLQFHEAVFYEVAHRQNADNLVTIGHDQMTVALSIHAHCHMFQIIVHRAGGRRVLHHIPDFRATGTLFGHMHRSNDIPLGEKSLQSPILIHHDETADVMPQQSTRRHGHIRMFEDRDHFI